MPSRYIKITNKSDATLNDTICRVIPPPYGCNSTRTYFQIAIYSQEPTWYRQYNDNHCSIVVPDDVVEEITL